MEGNGRLVSGLSPGCGANGSAALTVPRATFIIGRWDLHGLPQM